MFETKLDSILKSYRQATLEHNWIKIHSLLNYRTGFASTPPEHITLTWKELELRFLTDAFQGMGETANFFGRWPYKHWCALSLKQVFSRWSTVHKFLGLPWARNFISCHPQTSEIVMFGQNHEALLQWLLARFLVEVVRSARHSSDAVRLRPPPNVIKNGSKESKWEVF